MKSVIIYWPSHGHVSATIQDQFDVRNGIIYDSSGRRHGLEEFIRDPPNTMNLIYIGTMNSWEKFRRGLVGGGQPRPSNRSLTPWPDHGPDWPGPPPYSDATINFIVTDTTNAPLPGVTIEYGSEPPQVNDAGGLASSSGMIAGRDLLITATKVGYKPITFNLQFFGPTFHFHWQMAAAS